MAGLKGGRDIGCGFADQYQIPHAGFVKVASMDERGPVEPCGADEHTVAKSLDVTQRLCRIPSSPFRIKQESICLLRMDAFLHATPSLS